MRLIGEGNTSQIFEYEEGKVCKLFYKKYPKKVVIEEYENLKIANKLGISTTKVYDLVEIDGRFGIVQERLYGNDFLSIMMGSTDLNILELIRTMANLHKDFLRQTTENLINYKDFLKSFIRTENHNYNHIIQSIDKLQDGDYICHGDFHPGNIWMKENGELLIIDMMNLCKGPKEYDIARTFILISEAPLPENLSEVEQLQFKKIQQYISNLYLKEMNIEEKNIESYFDVIRECRKYEMNK